MKASVNKFDGERGIALIIVLGFLSLLILLTLSFSSIMRTERLAARNYADNIGSKNLVYAGLARALEDLDIIFTNNDPVIIYPEGADNFIVNDGDSADTLDDLVSESSAHQHIPRSMQDEALAAGASIKWTTITHPEDPSIALGRYAYLAVNCSGFLDVNYGGTAEDIRTNGTTAWEFDWDGLSEFNPDSGLGAPNFSEFQDHRSNVMEVFENYQEFYHRSLITTNEPENGQRHKNLFIHSMSYPSHSWQTNDTGELKITKKVDLTSISTPEFMTAIQQAGVRPPQVDMTFFENAYLDYVDDDSIPNHPDNASALLAANMEPIPMINEIVMSNWVEYVAGGVGNEFRHHIDFSVETWYPFPAGPGIKQYQVRAVLPPTTWTVLAAPGGAQTPAPVPTTPPPFTPSPAGDFDDPGRFNTHVFSYVHVVPDPPITSGTFRVGGNVSYPQFDVIEVATPATPVDLSPLINQVEALDRLTMTAPMTLGSSVFGPTKQSFSCRDPRFNWLAAQQWTDTSATAGRMNPDNLVNVNEGPSLMYVRNAPPETVWELGFLPLGDEPWSTVRLYETDRGSMHHILDVFTVGSEKKSRGLVNLNTTNEEVLAVGFYHAAIQDYPDQTIIPNGPGATPNIGWANAVTMAEEIHEQHIAEPGNIYNLSVLGHAARTNVLVDAAVKLTDARRESILGNSYRLFTLRQNVFTVIIAAQSGNDANKSGSIEEEEITGEKRAVAVVSRDPYPPNDSEVWAVPSPDHERPYVRYIKWLFE